ncbi:RHS repeat-associated core domain-containing protein [Cupriavidus malaysiensis]|uniref:RHS repeat-associated core domain-containing protein n=1 Tax=Cupriavidus malaysiensis TaxID=367825 RepID=UPI0009FD1EED|nr:RHS repeat-associated core domain-containing protein [Cupriavidus malaysiensis]
MIDDVLRGKRAVPQGGADRASRSGCAKVLTALAGALTLYLGAAEAGNVQFSTTLPAVAEPAPATAASAAQEAPIRRGREASPQGGMRRLILGQEFAPQPNTLRALLPPVSAEVASAHDAKVAATLPANLNAGGAIETLPRLNLKRSRAAASGSDNVNLQNFAEPKETGRSTRSVVTRAASDDNVVAHIAPAGPASLDELARALRNHPDLIYQYVRNNIELDPVRGIHKGALGAVLDNYGSPADQAQLMASLLRISGYDTRIVRGAIKLNAQQFADWFGVPTGNVCAVVSLMAQTQIPIYDISATQTGSCPGMNAPLTSISIEHVWVKANIGGTWYTFDPSYKPHVVKQGIDLNAAAGYNAAAFLQNAKSGATITPDLVRGLNRDNIRADLSRVSMNLADWIRKNKPTATLSDIIGGKSIVPFYAGALRQTRNPLADTSRSQDEWTEIPAAFKPTVRVLYQGIDQTFTSDAIYGKRLTITYNASNQPVLRLDGQAIGAPGSPVAPGTDSTVTFVVWHNAYPNERADHAFEQRIKGGGTYLIVNGWGPTGRGLSQYYLKNLEELRAAGHADTSEAMLGASLGVMGSQWISQTTNSASITDRLANAYTVQQHQVGIAGYTEGPYVDLPSNMSSPVQMTGDANLERAAFDSNGMHLSILESTAVNQTSGVPAVSTVKLLDQAMSQGQTIYKATSGNFASVQRSLANCQAHLGNFQGYLNQGFQLLIPANCQLAENRWKGAGYFVRGLGKARLLGSTIAGGYSGGYFTKPVPAPTYNFNTISTSKAPLNQIEYFGPGSSLGDPIDMVHGSFLYEHQDLKTGYGDGTGTLTFQRFYSSGMGGQTGPLGRGWTHNYDMSIRTASDGFLGMGDRLALDAVGTIVEHRASLDLLNDAASPADKFLAAVIAQRWFGDQLVDNTKIVKRGLNSDVFVRLPGQTGGGAYSSPPGKAAYLLENSNGWVLKTYAKEGAGTHVFDKGSGRIRQFVDISGETITFTWNGDRLFRVENSAGRKLTFYYNSNGRLGNVFGFMKMTQYAYDGNDNLISAALPGGSTRFEYDKPGRMTKFFEPSFPTVPVVTNVYDTLGRVRTQTSAAGNLFQYYFAGSRTEEVGPGGTARTFYIDGEGNQLQIGDPVGNWTLKDYDGQSRVVRETRPEGNRTEYAYDDRSCALANGSCTHNVATVSRIPRAGSGDPVLTQKFTYEPSFGLPLSSTDARGLTTSYEYRVPSYGIQLAKITRPSVGGMAPVTETVYEEVTPAGKGSYLRPIRVTEKIDGTRSVSTTISYAADGTPAVTTQDADGQKIKTVTTFDNEGRLISSQRDGMPLITYRYDSGDNVINTNANLLGSTESMIYDESNREVRRITYGNGGALVTCKRYNAMGDVVRSWGPAPPPAGTLYCPAEAAPTPITDTAYDDHHRPVRVTQFLPAADGGNRVTETVYNADDSVKSVRKAVGTGLQQNYVSYVYNPNGTVALTTDAKGNTTVNLYDGHDRLYRTHYPLDGSPGFGDVNNYEQYAWDANSNLIALRKRDGQTVTQTFDALNRLSSRAFPGGAGNVQYSYDLRGLKTASQFSNGSHTITNAYNALGQLTQTSAGGRTLRYSYDATGNMIDVAWPDGFHVSTTYDNIGRPAQLLENGTVSLAKYSYDQLNRRTQVELGNGTRTELTYDNQGWLSAKNHRFTSRTEDWIANFTRNQLGDITRLSVTNDRYGWKPSAGTSTYTANGLNQYRTAGGKAVTYDRNGNLTGDGTWTYAYDLDNRLRTATRAGTSATLDYDPEGRMIRTTINGTATTLLYNGQDLAAEYNAAGAVVRRYVFGPGIDEPLVQYEGPGTASKSWLYANQQGSIVALANSSGATTSSQAYGPFGETEGTPASRFGYTGQQYLAPLGLYYYKARMYSPVLGRFLQTDPIGYKDDLNWYAYVGNNPINATDPSGLAALCSTNNLMGVESKVQPIPTPAAITNSWSHQQSANLSDALSQGVVGPGIGAGVVKGIGAAAKAAGKETTTLYRAVTQGELKQIQATGKFEAGPNSLGGKWFAESSEHAEQWGNVMNGPGNSTVVRAQMPTTQANQLMRVERLDGIGAARYGELDQLKGVTIKW